MKALLMCLNLCVLLMVTAAKRLPDNSTRTKESTTSSDLCPNLPRDCRDLQKNGDSGKGVRLVFPFRHSPLNSVIVYCDHTVDGGGWTVFQRRTNLTVREDFYRTWLEYQQGFGNLGGEFWLGLDTLHALTTSSLQELRVDLADYEGEKRFAKYGVFSVGSEDKYYRILVGRYSGDAGDAMARHDGMNFSTYDADHEDYYRNCAVDAQGAWWYKDCRDANLNGYPYIAANTTYASGIVWKQWKGYKYSLKDAAMMIRPVH